MRKRLFPVCAGALLLVACSTQPQKPAEEKPAPKPEAKTEAITGRSAFQKLYAAARGWAGDARPVRLQSLATSDASGADGKAAVWSGLFASLSRRGIKPVIWSGSSAPDAPERGVNSRPEDNFNPANASTQPFDSGFLKIDSDAALATAQKHGGDKLLKKEPKTPVVYLLDWEPRANQLVWRVIYGTSRSDAKLVIDVDASSGDYIRTEK